MDISYPISRAFPVSLNAVRKDNLATAVATCHSTPPLLLLMISNSDSISSLNSRHRKTLAALFALPTPASIVFADIEAMLKALGAKVEQRGGSRVTVELRVEQWRAHRPHPGKEAKRYQVEEVRELLERSGIRP